MKRILFMIGFSLAVLPVFSQSADDYFSKAGVLSEQGYFDEAINYYNKSIEMSKGKNQGLMLASYLGKGRTYASMKKYDDAVAAFTTVVNTDPKEFHVAFRDRGNVKLEKGDISGAIADLTSAVTYEPRDGQSYFIRGTIYKNQGKLQEACADMQKSAQLGSQEARKEAIQICK